MYSCQGGWRGYKFRTLRFVFCVIQGFDLAPVNNKRVQLDFSAPKLSAFGGLAAIREYEQPGGIIDRIVSCIVDLRNQDLVVHSYGEMVRQRVYQIIAGYEDADDCDRLRSDGMLKLCAGRKPSDEIDLSSQPTMCRLENKLTKQELYAIAFFGNRPLKALRARK